MAIKYALLVYLVIGCAEICLGHHGTSSCTCDPAQSTKIPNPFYEFIRGFGYYKLSSLQATWDDAKKTCESEGAHLAIIDSIREGLILDELWRRMPNPNIGFYVYIGVRRIGGAWKTLSNKPLGFNKWETEPNDETMDCVAYSTETQQLKAFPCNKNLLYACALEV